MKLFAALAISAGLIAGPMLAESHEGTKTTRSTTSPRGLEEAKTLSTQTLSQAITYERQKVQRAEREAKLTRGARASRGEVTADYVGPSASSSSSADRVIQDEGQVQAPAAKPA